MSEVLVTILICSALLSRPDCQVDTATAVLVLPETLRSPAGCGLRGQAYLAQSALGMSLRRDEYVKITCEPIR
jgi:hypothetical protein